LAHALFDRLNIVNNFHSGKTPLRISSPPYYFFIVSSSSSLDARFFECFNGDLSRLCECLQV
jgi:hypothetical protein